MIRKILQAIKHFFQFIIYCLIYFLIFIFAPCKKRGKNNIRKEDQARIFISNHLEIYGPMSFQVHFKYKKAFWVHTHVLDPNEVEKQMGYGILNKNNYKWAPMWFRKLVIKMLKGLLIYVMNYRIHHIPVSQDDYHTFMNTLENTRKYVKKNYDIVIFPEKTYTETGFGDVYAGFVSTAKYLYKKDGIITTFYPVYIDKFGKKMHILEPIVYDPNDADYAQNIVNYITEKANAKAKEVEEINAKKSKKTSKRKK